MEEANERRLCHKQSYVVETSRSSYTHSDSEPSLPRTLLSPSFQTKQNHAQTPPENIRESSPVSGEDVKAFILWSIINNACSEKDSALFKHAGKALLDQHYDLAFIQKAKGPQYFSFWRDLGIKAGIGDILSRLMPSRRQTLGIDYP